MPRRVLVGRCDDLFDLIEVPAPERHTSHELMKAKPRHTADRWIATTGLAIDVSLLTAGSILVNAPDLQVLLAESDR